MLSGGTCAQQVPGRSRYLAGAAGQLAAESEVYKLKEIMASPTYRCTAIGYEHPAEPLVEHCAASQCTVCCRSQHASHLARELVLGLPRGRMWSHHGTTAGLARSCAGVIVFFSLDGCVLAQYGACALRRAGAVWWAHGAMPRGRARILRLHVRHLGMPCYAATLPRLCLSRARSSIVTATRSKCSERASSQPPRQIASTLLSNTVCYSVLLCPAATGNTAVGLLWHGHFSACPDRFCPPE